MWKGCMRKEGVWSTARIHFWSCSTSTLMVVITRSIKGFVKNTCVQGNFVGQLGEPCGIHSIFGICLVLGLVWFCLGLIQDCIFSFVKCNSGSQACIICFYFSKLFWLRNCFLWIASVPLAPKQKLKLPPQFLLKLTIYSSLWILQVDWMFSISHIKPAFS